MAALVTLVHSFFKLTVVFLKLMVTLEKTTTLVK